MPAACGDQWLITSFVNMKFESMKMTSRITATLLLAASIVFFACQKERSNGPAGSPVALGQPHSARIYLTDHQTPLFDSIFLDLQSLEVKLADDTLPNDGWVSLAIHPGVYNILRLRNGIDTLFATGTLPTGRVQKVRLTLGTQNSVVTGGQTFPLRVKSEDRQVVADLEGGNFEILPPNQVMFWIDFDASRSIQADNSGSGNNNGYRLKSSIRIFTRSTSGSIEGKVFPRAANPIVRVINGADTVTAIPEREGEYKIMGLAAGTYKVLFQGQNNYLDTTIQNVVVRNREDTHLPAITLHQ